MNSKGSVFFLLVFLSLLIGLHAQTTTIDFESGDSGTNWAWTVTENGSNPALTFPVNPDNTGDNTSATVAQFTAEDAGNPWALCYTDDIDLFEFDATNSMVSIMVYKPAVSPVAIKFEGLSLPVEIQISNTLIDQWEQIDFDFSSSIGNTYNRLVIIPDFADRSQDNIIYFDNIVVPEENIIPAINDASLSDLLVDGSTIDGFDTDIYIYNVELADGTTTVPTLTATTTIPNASYQVNDAAVLPGTSEVVVTAEDGITILTYSIAFTISQPVVLDTPAPTPDELQEDVISIYSDSYTDIAGTNFNPFWGQSTQVSFEDVNGNNMMKYDTFNYQGTQLNGNQDLSLMEYVHIDVWTEDATVVLFSPISITTGEHLVSLTPINIGSWNSYDIPLTDFVGMTFIDIHQLKFDGQAGVTPSTIYLDNIYFWKAPVVAGSDATLADLLVGGTTIAGFSSIILSYDYELANGTPRIPTITATTNDPNASYVVNNPASVPGASAIVVTADDNITVLTYTINFTYAAATPVTPAPTPTADSTNVISLYSDAYQDVTVDTWSAVWDQADVVDELINTDNVKLYTNFVYAGIEFTSQTIDATSMTHFHMDVWTPDDTSAPSEFKVKLVDFGTDGSWGGGDDVEHELIFGEATLNTESWVSLDIPLTDFINLTTSGHLAQLIISGTPNTVYVDNVYFYTDNPVALGIPQNVAVLFAGTDITISWDEVSGATSYVVYESDTPNGAYSTVIGGSYIGTSWTGIAQSNRRFYIVKAANVPVR
ncbi:MAG: hypothetical protein P9L91_07550 [Candidatus Zophobacter franzmannii]|nr:hypothetical protein [Candidatus Zophobacter franzmannii]